MESLVGITLQPAGAWITPWRADSLMGALAATWARSRGADALRRDFLDAWLAGEPPFVLSDAFPQGNLPAPAVMPLLDWADDKRKTVKKTRLLPEPAFREIQAGRKPEIGGENKDEDEPIRADRVRMRNSISRATDSAAETGGLFETRYSAMNEEGGKLTLYARATSDGMAILAESLETLGQTGYGAGAGVGHGAFDVVGEPDPRPELDDVPDADGFVSLSTFQPAPSDPTRGCWRAFVKYGKMAPEFQFAAIFKRPQAMLEPGACFRAGGAPRPFYGAAIPPERLLSEPDRERLAALDVHPVQPAFALALPMAWKEEIYE